MSSPNILVSGSGIAGSAFAFWALRAFPKAKITIVERAPALRLSGAAVDIRSSAVDIIKWMGLEPEVRKHGTKEAGMQLEKANQKPIATFRASGNSEVQSMTSEYEILRGSLAKVLIEPSLKKIKLRFDETVERYDQDDTGVTVTFTGRKETERYDLFVAADGLGSRMRAQMLDAEPRDHVHDEGIHVCYFTIKRDLLGPERLARGWSTTGGRCIYLRPDPHPEGRTSCLMIVVTTKKQTEMKARLNNAIAEGNEAYKKLMGEVFEGCGWLVPEVLQAMRDSDDLYCSLFGQTRTPKISDGRVVLLGDAGYATPGLGTSLAIMGGYVLAGEMLTTPSDIPAAVKRYEDVILPFAKSNQGDDNAMQYANPQTAFGCAVRDWVMWSVSTLRIDRVAMAGAAWFGFTEKKLKMPDYAWPKA